MAKEYKISGVYPVMKQDKITQSSFEAHGSKLFKWRLFFEGLDGHYLTNRKEDNPPKKGDLVYGDITEDNFGNPSFKSTSRPLDGNTWAPQEGSAPATAQLSGSDDKLDQVIALLEVLAGVRDVSTLTPFGPGTPAQSDLGSLDDLDI